METPPSLRRVTRSQTTSALQSQKSRQEDGVVSRSRTVLLDITNDSPIIGLAKKTPLTLMSKSSSQAKKTPGSGEALLRGQVKTLLQKVEEEAELVNKLSEPNANASQLDKILIAPPVVVVNGDPEIQQKVDDLKSIDCLINRALLFDSPGKAQTDGHVRASIDKEYGDDDDDDDDDECLDELIDGLMKISMQEDEKKVAEFAGNHIRFIYNSDDEIEGVEEAGEAKIVSPNVLMLKGLPVPEGKHLRFQDEDED